MTSTTTDQTTTKRATPQMSVTPPNITPTTTPNGGPVPAPPTPPSDLVLSPPPSSKTPPIHHKGPLWIRASRRLGKKWLPRFFILRPVLSGGGETRGWILEAMQRENSTTVTERWSLRDVVNLIDTPHALSKRDYVFGLKLASQERPIILRARSTAEVAQWMSVLKRCLALSEGAGAPSLRPEPITVPPVDDSDTGGDDFNSSDEEAEFQPLDTPRPHKNSGSSNTRPHSGSATRPYSKSESEMPTKAPSPLPQQLPTATITGDTLSSSKQPISVMHRLKNLVTNSSSSAGGGPIPTLAFDEPPKSVAAPQPQPPPQPPTQLDISQHAVYEYDIIEIFENQRWFPITRWGTRHLLHDRASFTNRTGASRTDWYRESLSHNQMVANNAADNATPSEELDDRPGPQVHVIRGRWEWVSSWKLSSLQALTGTSSPSLPTTEAMTKPPISPVNHRPSKESIKDESHIVGFTSAHSSPTEATAADHNSKSRSFSAGSVDSLDHEQREKDHNVTRQQRAVSDDDVVVRPGPRQAQSADTVRRTRFMSANDVFSADDDNEVVVGVDENSEEERHRAATVTTTTTNATIIPHTDVSNKAGEEQNQGWTYGWDFKDFDNALARGVPRPRAPDRANNVRTRRWVRVRRRQVQITARLPMIPIMPMAIVPLISFERQIVISGYLGTKAVAGMWKSRYYRLIRLCRENTYWDGGLGDGVLRQATVGYVLVSTESKESNKQHRETHLGLGDSARLLNVNVPRPTATTTTTPSVPTSLSQLSPDDCLTITIAQRFRQPSIPVSEETGGAVMMDSGSSPREGNHHHHGKTTMLLPIAEDPRGGRFEMRWKERDADMIYTADSRAEGNAWVDAFNYAVTDLTEMFASSPQPLLRRKGTLNGTSNPPPQQQQQQPRRLRFRRNRLNKLGDGEEDNDVEGGGGADEDSMAQRPSTGTNGETTHHPITDTGEVPVVCVAPPPTDIPALWASPMRERFTLDLPVSVKTFWQLFVAPHAVFSVGKFHAEVVGDENVEMTPWVITNDPGRDEMDMEGWDTVPYRIIKCKTLTGAPIGPASTRMEKRQRYYYYEHAGGSFGDGPLLVVKSQAKSLDVPFGDSFVVYERWIVTPRAGGGGGGDEGCTIRNYMGVIFLKSIFLKSTVEKSCFSGSERTYQGWKKVMQQYTARVKTAGTNTKVVGNDESNSGGGGGVEGDMSVPAIVAATEPTHWKRVVTVERVWIIIISVFLVWYVLQALQAQAATTQAMKEIVVELRMIRALVKGELLQHG